MERTSSKETSMTVLNRRNLIQGAALATSGLSAPSWLWAQGAEVTRILVGFPAGSSIDLAARVFAESVRASGGPNILIDNKPGAAGRIAMDLVKSATPNGRTLALVPSPTLTLYPHTFKRLAYNVDSDFTYLGSLCTLTHGLAVGPSVPSQVTTLQDFVAWGRTLGKSIFFSANAQGAGPHFLGLKFAKTAGLEFSYVPFQAGNMAATALMAGDLPAVVMGMADLVPLAKAGKIRLLANSGAARSQFAPDVPTFKELGHADLELVESLILLAPKGLEPRLVREYEERLATAVRDPQVVAALGKSAFTTMFLNGEDTKAKALSDLKKYEPEVRASGVSFDS